MYEDMTFQAIMERCLKRVPNSIDKREGSVIYDAIAPAAAELAQAYITLGTLKDDVAFPDTAAGVNLTKKAIERSIFRNSSSAAVRRAIFKNSVDVEMAVPLGTRYSGGELNFVVTEEISSGNYKAVCETPGAAGNQYFGTLIPIDFVERLGTATIGEVLIPGEDEETDDALRARYYDSLGGEAFGGNIKDYRQRIDKLPGVGGSHIYPVWNGGGSVRVVFVSSEWGVPSLALVEEVQSATDPETNHGKGEGFAPIGHTVTVQAAAGIAINIATEIQFQNGFTWQNIKPQFETVIQDYFVDLIKTWEKADRLVVRISQIETRALNIEGVVDIGGTLVNGAAENLALQDDEIPTLGTVDIV